MTDRLATHTHTLGMLTPLLQDKEQKLALVLELACELEEASYEQWADFLGKARQVQMALRDHVQLAGTIEEVEKLSKEVLCKEHICDLGAAVSAWSSLEDSACASAMEVGGG